MGGDTLGEVQDEAVGLAGLQAQPPAHHLGVEPFGEGGPKQDNGVNAASIEALGENINVENVLDRPSLESGGDGVTLSARGLGRHGGGVDAKGGKLALTAAQWATSTQTIRPTADLLRARISTALVTVPHDVKFRHGGG